MTERPIPFNAPMVRSVLAGTKTQTRRIVKGAPDDWAPIGPEVFSPTTIDRHGDEQPGPDVFGAGNADGDCWIRCPYGQPGDRLWVREAFRFTDVFDADSPSRVGERCVDAGYRTPWAPIQFEADRARLNWQHTGTPPHEGQPRPGKLRPAMFMPRWSSRITLEVTGVRVERLQGISDADAMAEGISCTNWNRWGLAATGREHDEPTDAFRALWESINGPGSWDANPWVWCVEFRRIDAAMGEKP